MFPSSQIITTSPGRVVWVHGGREHVGVHFKEHSGRNGMMSDPVRQ